VGKDGDNATKDKLREEMKAYAADLVGPNPTPLERTLADVASTSWFALRCYENADASSGSRSIHQADFAQRKIDRAHRRLMMTLKTLATVRKLAMPAILVNLARQQVNIAASTSGSEVSSGWSDSGGPIREIGNARK
jgi:hypothetical protein